MTPRDAAIALRASLVAAYKAKGSNLTEEEWLSEAVAVLTPILTPKKRQTGAGTGFSMGAGLSDDEWLAEIGAHPALVGVNVRQEVESCRLWSASRGVKPSRKRIVNWLLKAVADRPLRPSNAGQFAGGAAPSRSQTEMEPLNWREEFSDFIHKDEPWDKLSAFHRSHICQKMAELAQKQA